MFNPFKTFGLPNSASCQDIRLRYTHLLKKHHPDTSVQHKRPQDHSVTHIVDAYNILKDKDLRMLFIRYTEQGLTFATAQEFLTFKQRHTKTPSQQQKPDISHHLSLSISLEESLLGAEKKVPLINNAYALVTIPANTLDQTIIHSTHKHSLDQNIALDVTVFVVPHPFFQRENHNLICTCPISFAESLEGCNITIPTPYHMVKVSLPPFKKGQHITIKGEGVRTPSYTGDLVIHPVITPPERNTSCAQRVIAAEQAYPYDPRITLKKKTKNPL